METKHQRKGCLASSNWAAMDPDILCSIFNRLPFVDLHRVKSVCWRWHKAADLFRGCSATSLVPEMPWLIFTPQEEYEVTEGEKSGRFVDIEENKIYPFHDLAIKKMNDGFCYCAGSSHDWLICLDEKALPYLLNPFTSQRIDLPRIDFSLGVDQICGTGNNCYIKMAHQGTITRVNFVRKAVLSSSPSLASNYYLVIIYGIDLQLAFCKDSHSSWTKLNYNPSDLYADINFHENQLYGLYTERDAACSCFRIWDVDQNGFQLVRKIDILLDESGSMPPIASVLYFNFYLVEYLGSLLVVSRFVLYGDEINCPESPGSSETHLDLGRYRTSKFEVFKVDWDQNLCRMVTSLAGFALFLGRNRSISVDVRSCKRFKQDCIYFTDDYQDDHQRENVVDYSGHDFGVFSMKDNRVDRLHGNNLENRKSGPTWVVPHVKRLN